MVMLDMTFQPTFNLVRVNRRLYFDFYMAGVTIKLRQKTHLADKMPHCTGNRYICP